MASEFCIDSLSADGETTKSSDKDDNYSSSSSYGRKTKSLFDAKKKPKMFPPSQSSDWDEGDLEKIGILYNSQSTELSEMISHLKSCCPNLPEVPQFCRKLAEITRRLWTFSTNSAMLTKVDKVEDQYEPGRSKKMSEMTSARKTEFIEEQKKLVNESMENFDASHDYLKEEMSDNLKESYIANDLFYEWRNRLIGFWECFSSLVQRLSTTPIQMEGKYTELFREFCRIFFLKPEAGGTYQGRICVKSTTVHGVPDIRFVGKDAQNVLIVTEVKFHKALRDLETFTHKDICHHALGQHGMELLLELQNSFFKPFVMGIICIGTQLIFTSLSVDVLDLIKIEEKRDISSPHSYIFYSRPYDFMVESDRSELFEHLFWFGILQHGRRLDSLT